jgi:hypothetical protein
MLGVLKRIDNMRGTLFAVIWKSLRVINNFVSGF